MFPDVAVQWRCRCWTGYVLTLYGCWNSAYEGKCCLHEGTGIGCVPLDRKMNIL